MPTKLTTPNELNQHKRAKTYINADVIGAAYGISGRYVLKLAAEGRLPCIRIGRKCVRFDPDAVAAAIRNVSWTNTTQSKFNRKNLPDKPNLNTTTNNNDTTTTDTIENEK